MKRTRVEIGNLVLHGGLPRLQGATLQRQIETNLSQLLLQDGMPAESRQASVVQINGGPHHPGGNVAGAIARALYRSMNGKV